MKAPPYFKLTEVEPHAAIWAGILFMMLALIAAGFAVQRISEGRRAAAARSAEAAAPARSPTPRRQTQGRNGAPLPAR